MSVHFTNTSSTVKGSWIIFQNEQKNVHKNEVKNWRDKVFVNAPASGNEKNLLRIIRLSFDKL